MPKILTIVTKVITGLVLPAKTNPRIRRMLSFVVRNLLLVGAAVLTVRIVFDAQALDTLIVCFQAGLVTILLASLAQYTYTALKFNEDAPTPTVRNRDDDDPWVTELIMAARIKVLGLIFLGCSIVVGLTFFGVYYIKTLPFN